MAVTELAGIPAGGIVPMAFVGRASTDSMQNPPESLARQLLYAAFDIQVLFRAHYAR